MKKVNGLDPESVDSVAFLYRRGTDAGLAMYVRQALNTKLLTPKEEQSLAKRIKNGDDSAREEMISANLRLVVKIARGYENYGLPLLDLISEGNIGLTRCTERYDYKKGAKFSSYASFFIKHRIKRALSNQSKGIRIPTYVGNTLSVIRKCIGRLSVKNGYEPTDLEIALDLGMSVEYVRKYQKFRYPTVSLDSPVGDGNCTLGEFISDEKVVTPYEEIMNSDRRATIMREVVGKLSGRNLRIIQLRYGLNGEKPKTLDQISKVYRVSRERIRQVVDEILKKYRRKILGNRRHPLFVYYNS